MKEGSGRRREIERKGWKEGGRGGGGGEEGREESEEGQVMM